MADLRYLPLRPGTNIPAATGWQHRASNDPAILEDWAREFPGCNWGILTGDGLGVLDLDTKRDEHGYGGFTSMIDVEELLGVELAAHPMVETYTGAHVYFRYHGHLPTRVPWLPHLDVKADPVAAGGQGHQVAGPGTVRGGEWGERTYRLVRGSLDAIPYAPDSLITAIRSWRVSNASGSGGGGSSVDLPDTAWLREHGFRSGQRDNGFNTLAWKLTRIHYPRMDLVHQIIYEVWEHTDQPSGDVLPWAKVQAQIDRAEKSIGPEVTAQIEWARRRYGL